MPKSHVSKALVEKMRKEKLLEKCAQMRAAANGIAGRKRQILCGEPSGKRIGSEKVLD